MNRLTETLSAEGKILSIYATAGFPQLKDTLQVLKELENTGVDLIEIGMPFSDPLADGPTIQESSTKALMNGMTTELLFEIEFIKNGKGVSGFDRRNNSFEF